MISEERLQEIVADSYGLSVESVRKYWGDGWQDHNVMCRAIEREAENERLRARLEQRSDVWDMACRNAERARDEAIAQRDRVKTENERLRALLARWRQCFANLRPLIDSTLEQDTDAALNANKKFCTYDYGDDRSMSGHADHCDFAGEKA